MVSSAHSLFRHRFVSPRASLAGLGPLVPFLRPYRGRMFLALGALLLAALAYTFARKYAFDHNFTFGTGKFGDLAGFGLTDNPADFSIEARIAHVQSFIAFTGSVPRAIWGSSMGTYIGCVIALRDPKIAKFNVEELLDQRILTKVVKSGYVEEIERKYKLRP